MDYRHPASRGTSGDASFESVADQLFELHQRVRNSRHEAPLRADGPVANPHSSHISHHGNHDYKDRGDVSFASVDELSELLNESSVERHLDGSGQMERTPDKNAPQMDDCTTPVNHSNSTHERGSTHGCRQSSLVPGANVAHETVISHRSSSRSMLSSSTNQPAGGITIGSDSWSGIMSKSDTKEGMLDNSEVTLQPRPHDKSNSELTPKSSSVSETGTKNDHPRLYPGSASQPKPYNSKPDSKVTPKAKLKSQGKDASLVGGIQQQTSGTAHSSVDIYHLALQVRDKLSGIFEQSVAQEKVSRVVVFPIFFSLTADTGGMNR